MRISSILIVSRLDKHIQFCWQMFKICIVTLSSRTFTFSQIKTETPGTFDIKAKPFKRPFYFLRKKSGLLQ